MDTWQPDEVHRCEECIRPKCQRKLSHISWNLDISNPLINDYAMHDLYQG